METTTIKSLLFFLIFGVNAIAQSYCTPSTVNSGSQFYYFKSINAETDLLYTSSTTPPGGHEDATTLLFESYETQTIDFKYYFYGLNPTVNIWIDWNNDYTFDASEHIVSLTGYSIYTYSYTIPQGTLPGNYRVRVRGEANGNPPSCGSINTGASADFNLTILSPPSCIPPNFLTVNNATTGFADFSWTDFNNASEWQIEYVDLGMPLGSGNRISNITNNNYLVPVTPGEEYDFYVRSICNIGDTSIWVGPISYQYCIGYGYSTSRYLSIINSEGAFSDINYNTSTNPTDGYANETSQTFEAYEGQSFEILTAFNNSPSDVKIWIDWNGNLTFDQSELISDESNSALITHDITVPNGTPIGDYRVRIRGKESSTTSLTTCGDFTYGSTVDFNLSVIPQPNCLRPTDIVASSASPNSVDIGWTDPNGASEWEIRYGDHGFVPSPFYTFTQSVVNTNPFTLNITPGEEYDFYVRSICGPGDTSSWSGPFEYRYCDPYSLSNSRFISSVNSMGALDNISFSTFTPPQNGYSDETSQNFTSFEDQSFFISTDFFGGFCAVNLWVDWNKNRAFEPSELMGTDNGPSSNKTFLITVPNGVNIDDYRMRIRGEKSQGTPPPSCGLISSGSSIDFQLSIVQEPTCATSTNLMSNHIEQTAIEIGWTSTGAANYWNIEYGPTGFTQGSGVTMLDSVNSNPYLITGLTPNESYDFYIQSECGINQSTWTGPFTFSTLACPTIIEPDVHEACESFTWIDGNTYTSSNNSATYTFIEGASNGCDSTLILDLTIHHENDAGSNNSIYACINEPIDLDTLTNASSPGEWFDESFNPLGQSVITTPSIDDVIKYYRIISEGSCEADTAHVYIEVEGNCDYLSNTQDKLIELSVFPNPAKDQITILNPSQIAELKIEMIDMNGRVILVENQILNNVEKATINIHKFENGIYTLNIYNTENQKTFKIVKL
ncbi:GEVED domain-containing protein [Brumimicrobium aurantiacum]|uniref:T9SS C-terminal target domain-containing protein n=1 Tax=Brumimicrobium aurantiacum TaxID=1737063 RepID=A0A3E1EWF2_9FLAO|nr:GEVED domain-containing protein [Brumimicrobium aurantiacum]RFC53885.1 T9SS C-terminal target domain-containing protein [Brumimicrobium aurantiacum]